MFLTSGHISLTKKLTRGKYIYPGGNYEGIELFIDPDTAQNGQPMLRDSFSVDLAQLRAKYCPNGETFIAKLPLPDNLSSRRPGFSDAGGPLRRVSMQTGVIDLLALLLYGQAPEPVLLTSTRLSVIDAANRVGYLNQSKFSTAFRRTHGVSPREYRTSRMLPAEPP